MDGLLARAWEQLTDVGRLQPADLAELGGRVVRDPLADLEPVVGDLDRVAGVELARDFDHAHGQQAGPALAKRSCGPGVDDDPVAAWRTMSDGVQALLDDPASADTTLRNPHIGEVPLPEAVSRFFTADVFMHTWDLARATGQDDRLDPAVTGPVVEGMEQMEEVLRSSGQFGVRVPVGDDADAQTRLLGFIGRDPDWKP